MADLQCYSQLSVSKTPLVHRFDSVDLVDLCSHNFELRSVASHRNVCSKPPALDALQVADVHKMTRFPPAQL